MGTYMDFFIASPQEAEAIAESDHPLANWPNFSLRGIFDIELGELWALIDDIDPEKGTNELFSDILYQPPEDEVIVCAVNSKFVDALAGIPVDDAEKYAGRWAKSECFDGSPLEVNIATEIVTDLSNFARQARDLNKPVLFLGYT